jgi:Nuclease-related domain
VSSAFSRRRQVDAALALSTTTADVLETPDAPFTAWRDVALPGTRATIDHVVLGPAGLFVVEVRTYRWPIRARRGQLRSGDFPLQGVLEMVSWKAERLRAELAVQVSPLPRPAPVLCIEGGMLP